jgi:branched-chain amino acid transport system substrate-binding protein
MLFNITFNRRSLFLGLIIAIILSDSIIFFAQIKSREFYSSWIITINASIASALAIFALYRQKHLHGLYGKTHVLLAIGLSLWLCADIIWAVYAIVLEVVPPVPSAADFLWLSAYGFLACYLFMTYIEFHKKFKFSIKSLIPSILGSIIFLGYIISFTANLSDLSSPRGIAMFTVIVAYPILDAILMVPAIVILVNFRKEPLWFTPWICEALGIFLIAISDSWFALVVITSLVNQLWLSAIFFAAHYLVIAGGLLWYIKFSITYTHKEHGSSSISSSLTTSSKKIIFDKVTKPTLEKKARRKKLSRPMALISAISIISIIALAIVTYSLHPSSSLLPFFSFANVNSEIVIPSPSDSKHTITLGALLPLTGSSSSLGESENAALQIAVKDVNNYFSKRGSNSGVGLVIEDTQTNPETSLEKLKLLAKKGISIVIGPATSAALQAVQDYANKNNILLVSPSSTSPTLAIEGDNVFRFVSNDIHQAQAISRQMWNDGIRIVVPFWRTDVYGNDLVKAVKDSFRDLGGRVAADGVGYTPHTSEFSASLNRINFLIWEQDLRSLNSKVNQAIAQYGANKVGIYLVAFDEVAPIFIQAQSHPLLEAVKWYGSDGSALNNKLVRNVEAANFAVKTNFLNPIYGVEDDNDGSFKRVESQIHDKIERIPRSYASVAYDILWVAALTENDTKVTHDFNYLKRTFVRIADSYKGITGNTTLDKVGDRKYGDYDFWAIRVNDGGGGDDDHGFTWKRVGKYVLDEKTKQEFIK